MAATSRPRYRSGAIAKGVNGGEMLRGFPRAGLSITTPVAASAESDADRRKVKRSGGGWRPSETTGRNHGAGDEPNV
jgi:hypothetical protein